jgi:hypothetical protein
MLTCGTLELFMTTWNTLLSKNAYMWDPGKIYDDSEHYFRNNAYTWDPTEFYDNMEHYVF